MNDFKRLIRYAQEIPASRFTTFQQGMIHGAALAGAAEGWEWLEAALDRHDAEQAELDRLQRRA